MSSENRISQSGKDCGLCLQDGKERKAEHFCENCKSYICDSCKDSHKKFQELSHHVISPYKIEQHCDSSAPSDVSDHFSHLSTKPSETNHVASSEPEDVVKEAYVDSKPSCATEMSTKPDDHSHKGNSPSSTENQKVINVLKDVNFSFLTKVYVRGLEDTHQVNIVGCCFMPGGEMVLCDFWARKVKLLDASFSLIDILEHLPGGPCDVAALDSNTAVITVEKQLQFVQVLPSLKKGRVVSLDKECYGIDVACGQIYVCCYTPRKNNRGEIRIYDFHGNLKKQIGRKTFSWIFDRPNYISVSRDGGKIFVIDDEELICVTDDGKKEFTFKEFSLQNPQGLYVDDSNNLIMCSRHNETVTIISEAGTKFRTLLHRMMEYENQDALPIDRQMEFL